MDTPPDASNPSHPSCILRLASAVHRFRLPGINPSDQLSFEKSFKTCSSSHKDTIAAMRQVSKLNFVRGLLNFFIVNFLYMSTIFAANVIRQMFIEMESNKHLPPRKLHTLHLRYRNTCKITSVTI